MHLGIVRRLVADALAMAVFLGTLWAFLPETLAGTTDAGVVDVATPGGPVGSLGSYLLDDATVRMLRLLLVAGGAFVLAAFSQRIVLGAFAFEAAGFKLPAEGATKEALQDTVRLLERHRTQVLGQFADKTATAGAELHDLGARLAALETAVARLATHEPDTMASSRRDDQNAEGGGKR